MVCYVVYKVLVLCPATARSVPGEKFSVSLLLLCLVHFF